MSTTLAPTEPRATIAAPSAPAERAGTGSGEHRAVPICDCPEFCLLDHTN